MAEDADDPFSSIQRFEWDEMKRMMNMEKHGVDFADAVEVFSDPRQLTYRSRIPSSEQRYVSIGRVRSRLLAVITTLRGGTLRIISARAARRNERERYGQEQDR